ncbi:sigma factor [Paenibacillus chibensis]|nr:sigma factor [Paenibacillus chibensis]
MQALSEEEARALYETHSPYVYGIAFMLTRSAAAADDIMQETFLCESESRWIGLSHKNAISIISRLHYNREQHLT